MSEEPARIATPLDYLAVTYGEDMSYWEEHPHPGRLPVSEREAWHRDAWDREQDALLVITRGAAGGDTPEKVHSFGYDERGTALEQ